MIARGDFMLSTLASAGAIAAAATLPERAIAQALPGGNVVNPGTGSGPYLFRFDDTNQVLTTAAVSSGDLFNPGAGTVAVTLKPGYVTPGQPFLGRGKEYASVQLTFAQSQSLQQLDSSQKLAWSNIWNLVTSPNNDIPTRKLSAQMSAASASPTDTFQKMPSPDGQGRLALPFIWGTLNNNTGATIARAMDIVKQVAALAPDVAPFFAIPASLLDVVNNVSALITGIANVSSGATFEYEITNDLLELNVSTTAVNPAPDYLVPARLTKWVAIRNSSGSTPNNVGEFKTALAKIASKGQKVQFDNDLRLMVVDAAGNEVRIPTQNANGKSVDSAGNPLSITPLGYWTTITFETSVGAGK